jgi:hypothetical protein
MLVRHDDSVAAVERVEEMSAHPQAEFAQRVVLLLNAGVLQDAVWQGLEDQGPFEVDVLDVLDALDGAQLKLVADENGEASRASAALAAARRPNEEP